MLLGFTEFDVQYAVNDTMDSGSNPVTSHHVGAGNIKLAPTYFCKSEHTHTAALLFKSPPLALSFDLLFMLRHVSSVSPFEPRLV